MPRDLVSLRQAAELFGVHRNTLGRYVAEGKLTTYTQAGRGNATLLDRAELARLFEPTPNPPHPSRKPGEPRHAP